MFRVAIGCMAFLLTGNIFADTQLYQPFSPSTATQNKSVKVTPPHTTTLSPQEFKNAVNNAYQQNQAQLDQQVQQNLTKNLPVPPPTADAPSNVIPQSNPNATADMQNSPATQNPPTTTAPSDSTVYSQQPATVSQPPSVTPAPTQGQPYTGFGGGGNNNTKGNNSNQKSTGAGGWNIQY